MADANEWWAVRGVPSQEGETPEQYRLRVLAHLDRQRPAPPWWAWLLLVAGCIGAVVVAAHLPHNCRAPVQQPIEIAHDKMHPLIAAHKRERLREAERRCR